MKKSLGLRLFLSYLVVILVSMVVMVVVTQLTLPGAYGRHLGMMEQMGSSQDGAWMGLGRSQVLNAKVGEGLFSNFRSSFYEALLWAGMVTLVAALAVSGIISRGISSPVHAMTVASLRISEGHYDERVANGGKDELGLMANSFNSMASKLEQNELFRRQLIGDVAHELRTPLTTIQGSMEGLTDGILPATTETFEQIRQETFRLSQLVDDLQELSRVEAGAYRLDRKLVSVADLVSFTLKRMQHQFDVKKVALVSEINTSLPLVNVDEHRIGQVLLNLLGNALQFTPAGGMVIISAELNGSVVEVGVKDNGIGVPEEHLAHIFDRFYRVDKSRSRSGGGSGVGLTISKYLIEAHGGRIWAESKGQGMGSTFHFTLPLAG
jgi:two-component system sensor histidine kinase BaeS